MNERSKRIHEAVVNAKLSYVELGRLTGISKSALQRYASGQTQKIPIDVIEKIAAATGVTARYLMGWDDDEFENVSSEDIIDDLNKQGISKGMHVDALLTLIDQMTPDNRKKIEELAELLLLKQSQDEKKDT